MAHGGKGHRRSEFPRLLRPRIQCGARPAPVAGTSHQAMRRLVFFFALAASAQVRQLDPAAIERVANEELRATRTPGAAVAVVSGDRIIFSHGYGVSSVETGAPVSPDMLFRLGSTTKMFTAAALTGLDVDLDAPVGKYISGLDPAIAKLTANQLL